MKTNFLRPHGAVTSPCLGASWFSFDWHGADGVAGQGDTVQPGDAWTYPAPAPAEKSPSCPGKSHKRGCPART